jgi:hypothetical protein
MKKQISWQDYLSGPEDAEHEGTSSPVRRYFIELTRHSGGVNE